MLAPQTGTAQNNWAQFGIEYDDNVFKTFNTADNDFLLKLLLKTEQDATVGDHRFGLAFQGGGRKYITLPEQDTIIGQLDLSWNWSITEELTLELSNELKGQLESGTQNSANTDITENFVSNVGRFQLSSPFIEKMRQQLYVKIIYFTFFGDLPIDFTEEHFGTVVSRPFGPSWSANAGYDFSLSQFPNSPSLNRNDYQHEVSAGVSYVGPFLLNLGYAYLDDQSSVPAFSSTGHKISTLFSLALGDSLTLQLLGTLQIRSYRAIVTSDLEGTRLLFSDSEDTNFNTVTVKLSKRFSPNWAAELKYSRFSNEFSDREDAFSRNLFMLGLRAGF